MVVGVSRALLVYSACFFVENGIPCVQLRRLSSNGPCSEWRSATATRGGALPSGRCIPQALPMEALAPTTYLFLSLSTAI